MQKPPCNQQVVFAWGRCMLVAGQTACRPSKVREGVLLLERMGSSMATVAPDRFESDPRRPFPGDIASISEVVGEIPLSCIGEEMLWVASHETLSPFGERYMAALQDRHYQEIAEPASLRPSTKEAVSI